MRSGSDRLIPSTIFLFGSAQGEKKKQRSKTLHLNSAFAYLTWIAWSSHLLVLCTQSIRGPIVLGRWMGRIR